MWCLLRTALLALLSTTTAFDPYCGAPESLQHGEKHGDDFTLNSMVRWTCDVTYRLVGAEEATCVYEDPADDIVFWSAATPLCEKITCEALVRPINGGILGDNLEVDRVVYFNCDNGYVLQGASSLECKLNGSEASWNNVVPHCTKYDCEEPLVSDMVTVIGDDFTFDSRVSFECDVGTRIVGASDARCTMSGWDNTYPSCEAIVCEASLQAPANGSMDGCGNSFGDMCSFSCNKGFLLHGLNQSTCQTSGWSSSAPSCKIRSCDRPHTYMNSILHGTQYTFGSTVQWACYPTFRLVGEMVAKCRQDGTWSVDAPICEKIRCAAPFHPPNGEFHGRVFDVNSTVVFSCQTAHVLRGEKILTCLQHGDKGMWDHHFPKCIRSCGAPGAPRNGSVIGGSFTVGSQVQFDCHTGFSLLGASIINCTLDGRWDAGLPSCTLLSVHPSAAPQSLIIGSTAGAAILVIVIAVAVVAVYMSRRQRARRLAAESAATALRLGPLPPRPDEVEDIYAEIIDTPFTEDYYDNISEPAATPEAQYIDMRDPTLTQVGALRDNTPNDVHSAPQTNDYQRLISPPHESTRVESTYDIAKTAPTFVDGAVSGDI